ncbi:RNA lariat debranching enzyme [Aureococcus anophagefferens]|nr:RNA lariat debranching enzyme [Aureococcus anophagefferens]
MPSYLNVMIEGCCHGALDDIYAALREVERRRGVKVDLLICCGDFQGLRSEADFEALAVPAKYREMNSFVKYYRGEAEAPCLTVFVGGNHEAVRVGGLRISGLSGIYNGKHHRWDHFENTADAVDARDAVRSAYHVREVDVFRLALLGRGEVDAFISHDWPRGVEQFGDVRRLLRRKKHFADEVARNDLGSPANELLLKQLRPTHWFSAHLHVKFAALASPQTDAFLDMLGLPHVVTRPCAAPPAAPAVAPPDPAEIALDDDDDAAPPVADPAEIALADDDDDDDAAPVADPAEIALADDDSETG